MGAKGLALQEKRRIWFSEGLLCVQGTVGRRRGGEDFQCPNIRNHALLPHFPGHVSLPQKRTRHVMKASLKQRLL